MQGSALIFFGERILRVLLNFVTAIVVARAFGVEAFGYYSLWLGLLSIVLTAGRFGLEGPLVTSLALIRDKDKINTALVSAFLLLIPVALAIGVLLFALRSIVIAMDEVVYVTLSLALIIGPLTVCDYYFHGLSKMRALARMRLGVYSVGVLAKSIAALMYRDPIIIFYLTILELFVVHFLTLYLYIFEIEINPFGVDWFNVLKSAVNYFRRSYPLAAAAVMTVLYTKIDQWMISVLSGYHELGLFSVALRISDTWILCLVTLTLALTPVLSNIHAKSSVRYKLALTGLLAIMFRITVAFIIFCYFFGAELISLAFGAQYKAAGNILVVLLASSLFAAMGSITARHMTMINQGSRVTKRVLCALCVNVAMNIFLIPYFGGIGAAVASLVSLAVSNLFFDLLERGSRELFDVKLSSAYASWRICLISYRLLVGSKPRPNIKP
jgi:PST family polysaccharide transporter